MIKGMHGMFYSDDPEALRAFIRDKLGFTYTDVGDGWLIFDMPESDLGIHPTTRETGGAPTGTHSISFYCDDIEATVGELQSRGVEFTEEVTDRGYALSTRFEMPGGVVAELYQPHYTKGVS